MLKKGKLCFFFTAVIATGILYTQNKSNQVEYSKDDKPVHFFRQSDSSSRDEQISGNRVVIQGLSPGIGEQQQNVEICVEDCVTGERLGRCLKYDSVEEFSVPLDTVSKETGEHRQDAFKDIYLTSEWSKDTRSGPGSTLEKTQTIRTVLDKVISDIKVALNKTTIEMVDVPCGDLTWMRQFLAPRNDVMYTGVDIVAELIRKHSVEFKNNSKMNFLHKDIALAPLDKQYDLIFSRSMTQHLTNYDTMKVLLTFSQSHSSYLMMSNFPVSRNHDLNIEAQYRYRGQNVEIPPYSLAPPICQSNDGDGDVMSLWRLPLKRVKNCTYKDVSKFNAEIVTSLHVIRNDHAP